MRQILKILFLFSTTIFVNQYKNHTNILINIKIVGHTLLTKKKKVENYKFSLIIFTQTSFISSALSASRDSKVIRI